MCLHLSSLCCQVVRTHTYTGEKNLYARTWQYEIVLNWFLYEEKNKDEEEKVGQDGGLGLYSPSSPLLPLSPLQRRLLRSISKDPVSLVESNLFAGKNGTALVLECHAIRSTRITSKNKHQKIQRKRQKLGLLVYVSKLCWLYLAIYFKRNVRWYDKKWQKTSDWDVLGKWDSKIAKATFSPT